MENSIIFLQADNDTKNKFWFSPIQLPVDIIILGSMFSIYCFVFLKLKFKMDLSGILTLLWQLIVALQRLIQH